MVYKFINKSEFSRKEDFLKGRTFGSNWLTISGGEISIETNYAWNGCSPKFQLLDLIIGTPDGATNLTHGYPKAYYASMVHDALYQYKSTVPVTRKEADWLFYKMLKEENFFWAKVYYAAVRLFGWTLGKWRGPLLAS